MLSLSRKFGESVLIGSVRFTFISWRQKVAEVLVVRGAAVSFSHLQEDELHHVEIDGERIAITWRRKWTGGRAIFTVIIDAPKHIKIYRSELLEPAAATA